jgi:hypothetical protein
MITPADQLLARSDTALPGLDCLLDTDWVSHALEAELGLDAADLALRSTYIRYKRGTSCLVGFTGIHQHKRIDFYARLHCPDDQPKAAKPLASRLTESEFGPGALLLPDPCLVFLFFPNDHLMKPLQRLVDHQRRHKVLRDLLPRHSPASAAVLTPLRYKPERRFVGKVTTADGSAYLLKVHARGYRLDGPASVNHFHADGAVHLRRRLAVCPESGLALYPWIGGQPLTLDTADQLAAIGSQLARLHSLNPCSPPTAELGSRPAALSLDVQVATALAALAAIAPAQLIPAGLLAQHILRCWHHQPSQARDLCCLIHGDFSADQVIVDAERFWFIDFDRAAHGHPVHDLGSFVARLHHDQITSSGSGSCPLAASQALIDGYLRTCPVEMEGLIRPSVALHLLKLAPEAFRLRDPHWPIRLEQVLSRAAQILEGVDDAV